MDQCQFNIPQMDCQKEVTLLKKALLQEEGINKLDFDLFKRRLIVFYEAQKITPLQIQALIKKTGMNPQSQSPSFWNRHEQSILTITSGLALFLGLILQLLQNEPFADFGGFDPDFSFPSPLITSIYLLSILLGAWTIAPRALASVRYRTFDMNVLMMIAVIAAIAIGQLFEAAAVTFLFSLSLVLEKWSVDKAQKTIDSLFSLTPPTAWVFEQNQWIQKPIEQVPLNTRILIRPGERIPLDGTVLKGSSLIDQSPITGESKPIEAREGTTLYAGSINSEGAIELNVTKDFENTTLSQIVSLVSDAKKQKANFQRWIDRFAQVYTPAMVFLSLAFALIPPLLWQAPFKEGIYRGLVLLVIACPCALVISTPVTIVCAIACAARQGIIIKGGKFLETLAKLKSIAFDKTGTITQGTPTVQSILPLNGHTEEELLQIAASLEEKSEHLLAKAILKKAQENSLTLTDAQNFTLFKGLGAEGTLDGKPFWIGSHRFMHQTHRKECAKAHETALQLEDAGHSVVAIGDFSHICGLMSIADQVRPGAKKAIEELKLLGIELIMLTGDNQKTAQDLAQTLKINVKAELMPEEKLEHIKRFTKTYGTCGMVGDGINDAPALAASSVGIAMGQKGTDLAFETADVVLMKDDLEKLPWLLTHAKRAFRTINQNVAFSLGLKGVFITLALLDLATLWMAIGADTGASLLVIFNGMRMLSPKKGKRLENPL